MRVDSLAIPDVKVLWPKKFGDDRGFFSETWNRATLRSAGIDIDFIQENHSLSRSVGTVRGLHYQVAPVEQNKVVRVISGRILDVSVDLRKASPTYGQWVAAEISAQDWNQILVPVGFAHGFCTLEPDTQVIYLVDAHWSAAAEGALLWNDPDLAIDWPVAPDAAHLADKDRTAQAFANFQSPF
jgi:dTDP-4-dehydrorhamnose 3,5-epimerase